MKDVKLNIQKKYVCSNFIDRTPLLKGFVINFWCLIENLHF
jgi:hypothetical protein